MSFEEREKEIPEDTDGFCVILILLRPDDDEANDNRTTRYEVAFRGRQTATTTTTVTTDNDQIIAPLVSG